MKCKPGDMLFVHTTGSILSWAVMYYTGPTIWSHVATFGRDGYLYDCTTQGVIEHHISDYFDGKSYIAVISLSSDIPKNSRKKMMLFCEQKLGNGFNWKGIFFFWLRIITGNDEDFRLCCVADIFILLSVPMLMFYKFPTISSVFFFLSIVYILVVAVSRIHARFLSSKRTIPDFKHENKSGESVDEYVVGKNIIDDLINLSLEELEKYFIPFEHDFASTPALIIAAYNNMASKLTKIEDYDKAEMLYNKAIKYCDDSTSQGKLKVATILNNLAGVYFEKKNLTGS